MIKFEEVKEMFKKSIDATDTMNQALENLMQSIYQKGYNDALDKIRAEIQAMADDEWNTQVGSVSQGLEDAIDIIDKYKAESEGEE